MGTPRLVYNLGRVSAQAHFLSRNMPPPLPAIASVSAPLKAIVFAPGPGSHYVPTISRSEMRDRNSKLFMPVKVARQPQPETAAAWESPPGRARTPLPTTFFLPPKQVSTKGGKEKLRKRRAAPVVSTQVRGRSRRVGEVDTDADEVVGISWYLCDRFDTSRCDWVFQNREDYKWHKKAHESCLFLSAAARGHVYQRERCGHPGCRASFSSRLAVIKHMRALHPVLADQLGNKVPPRYIPPPPF